VRSRVQLPSVLFCAMSLMKKSFTCTYASVAMKFVDDDDDDDVAKQYSLVPATWLVMLP